MDRTPWYERSSLSTVITLVSAFVTVLASPFVTRSWPMTLARWLPAPEVVLAAWRVAAMITAVLLAYVLGQRRRPHAVITAAAIAPTGRERVNDAARDALTWNGLHKDAKLIMILLWDAENHYISNDDVERLRADHKWPRAHWHDLCYALGEELGLVDFATGEFGGIALTDYGRRVAARAYRELGPGKPAPRE